MLYVVLYAILGAIVINRLELEGFGDCVEEYDLLCVSIDDRQRTSEVFYGLTIWFWPVVAIKSIIQKHL